MLVTCTKGTISDPLLEDKIEKYIIDNGIYIKKINTLENECMCSFSREWWQRTTNLENEHTRSFLREEVVVAKNNCP